MKRAYSLIVAALSVSLFIYLIYRPENTVVNRLVTLLLSPTLYAELRTSVAMALPLNEPVLYSLPGGLWVFSVTVLSKDMYIRLGDWKLAMVLVPVTFATGLEFLQLVRLTHGTFDPVDIASYLLFWLLAYFGFQSAASHANTQSPLTPRGLICMACFFAVYLAHVSR